MNMSSRVVVATVIFFILFLTAILAYHNLFSLGNRIDTNIGQVGDSEQTPAFILPTEGQVPGSVFFLGDISLARDVERRIKREGVDYPYRQLSLWDKDSLVFANFESAVPAVHVPTPDNTFRFSTKVDFLPALKQFGVTHVSLANNHSFDFGAVGYNHTLTSLTDVDILPFGHPSLVSTSSVEYINLDQYKIAVVAMHTLYSYPDLEYLSSLFEDINKKSDFQIAYTHWGSEYNNMPDKEVINFADKLTALGFDAIIGHHPHVLQGVGLSNNALVFYSLGNFIFDQYFSEEVQTGLILEMSVIEANLSFKLHPVSSLNSRNQPYLLEGEAKDRVLSDMSLVSDSALISRVASGTVSVY
jgi:poly-gamma-glutamate synthesis protein (capsule biosynthesis protein)